MDSPKFPNSGTCPKCKATIAMKTLRHRCRMRSISRKEALYSDKTLNQKKKFHADHPSLWSIRWRL